MRDLVFKNLTSADKKRKILASSEVIDKEGVHSIIRRHFVCMVREVKGKQPGRPLPSIWVIKERNHKAQRERFFCKIKGSVYAVGNGKLFLIMFMHTLTITLVPVKEKKMDY